MANIVLIEKDGKITREIGGFIQELGDDHRVRSFSTIEAFEALYFADPTEKILKKVGELPWLQTWPRLWVERMVSVGLVAEKPKSAEKIKLAFHKEHWILHRIEGATETFLGKPIDSLTNKPLEQVLHIPEIFKVVVENFKNEVKKSSKSQITFPIELKSGQAFNVYTGTATANALECEIILEDITSMVLSKISNSDSSAENSGDKEALQLMSTVHILIIQGGLIKKDQKNWLTQTFSRLKAGGYFPEESTTRFVILKWEDDGRTPEDYVHPIVEDVIYLPLDRLIFLQKMEIISKLPKKSTPSYLFSFKTSIEAEISKRSLITEINDIGFKLLNPVAIKPGVFAHFFIQPLTKKGMISVFAKARSSEAHPSEKGKFLVHFDFFGITTRVLTEIRKITSGSGKFKMHVDTNERNFKFNPDNLFYTPEQKATKTVLYFDVKSKESDSVVEALKTEIENVRVIREISLSRFIQNFFPNDGETFGKLRLLNKDDFQNFYPTITIGIEDLSFKDIDVEVADYNLFEYSLDDLNSNAELWLKFFATHRVLEEVKEYVHSASQGTTIDTDLVVKLKSGEKVKTGLEVRPGLGSTVSILFKPCKSVDIDALGMNAITSLDCIIANHTMVPTEIEPWVKGVNDFFQKKGLSKKPIPFIVVGEEKSSDRFREFCHSSISALLIQPINRKALVNLISHYTGNPFTINRTENLGWSSQRLVAYVARETTLENMAEFGATFVTAQPMAVGTTIYLHCEVFEKASDAPVLARVYGSEPHPQNKDQHLCFVLFFGIQDQFLKFTRSWIRETYASSKQHEG